jgi:hypothetical protein
MLARPEGTLTIGLHVTLVSRWLDPGETDAAPNRVRFVLKEPWPDFLAS